MDQDRKRTSGKELTHFDSQGNARMVDVSEKNETKRTATAVGTIRVSAEIYRAIKEGNVKKGDVLGVAQVAGIMGAKRTPDQIPLCHPLLLTGIDLTFETDPGDSLSSAADDPGQTGSARVTARCTVRTTGQTGVEMEALCGVSAALLTVYDMCKAIDKRMVIEDIHLVEKDGGKSGHFVF